MMSYNGYNYSPYFQQASENGRSQQSFLAQSQANAPYYRQPQHYTLQQTESQLPPASRPDPGVYTEHQYTNTDAARGGRSHSGGDQQPFEHSHSHPEVHSHDANTAAYSNTSALGSLTYSSGLGAAQIGRSARARTNSPLTGPNMNPAQSQPATITTRTVTVGQPTTSSASNGHYPSPRSDSRNSGISQPDGRATTQHSYTPSGDHQSYGSYDIRLRQAQHQGQNLQHLENGTKHSKVSSNLQTRRGISSDVVQPRSQLAGVAPRSSSTRHAVMGQQWMATTGGRRDRYNHTSSQTHYARPGNEDLSELTPPVTNDHEGNRSASNIPQRPTTVDPSHVFNHYEYQRRKTAAVTEVLATRRASETVEALNEQSNSLKTTATNQPNENPPSRSVASTVSDEAAHASPSERDQIEDDMKTMIERMREYKAKNPTLFSQIWEQVKRGQSPHQASSQAPSSAKEPGEASKSLTDKTVEMSCELSENGQLPSPSLTTVQHLSAVESPPELLPDLGRFPAQRRKRYSKKSLQTVSSLQLHDTPTKYPTSSESTQAEYSHAEPSEPIQTDLSKDNSSNVGLTSLSKADASMRQAMEAFQTASAKTNSTVRTAIPLQRSSSTSPGKTIWPENKKMALASAAKIALTSAPVNAGKDISSQDIHQLLDQNPSYTELCETLEARGFVLDRGHFARLLLAAVPDVNAGTPSHTTLHHSPQNTHTIGSLPEPRQQLSLALAAGSFQPDTQEARAPLSTETLRSHFTSNEPSRGRPRKDGLPPHQRTEVQRDADPAMLPVPTNQPSIADLTVSVNAKDLSVIAPGQYSAPGLPVTAPRVAINTQVSTLKDPPWQAQQSQEHAIVKNGNVLLAQPQTPLPGSVPSRASTSSGFGMLELTNTFVPQHTIAPQSAHVSDYLLNRGSQPAANPQNGHINLSENLNTPLPTREYRPVPSAQPRRTGPSHHAFHKLSQPQAIPKARTKEEVSRKRNFSDIVDLTQLSEDDQVQHNAKRLQTSTQPKKQRLSSDSTPPHTPTLNMDSAASRMSAPYSAPASAFPTKQQVTRMSAVHERSLGNNFAPISEHSTPTTHSTIDLSQFNYAARDQSVQRELLKVADIIQPLDKNNALRRSTYNVKTIARDVLIAAGHHPKDKALNWHLTPLLINFRHVNYGSDLSTFNWDLVDPVEQTVSTNTIVKDDHDVGDAILTEQAFPAPMPMRRHSTRAASTVEGDPEAVSVDIGPPRLNKGINSQPHRRRLRRPNSIAQSEDTTRRLPSGAISAFTNTSISQKPAGSTQTSSSGHTTRPHSIDTTPARPSGLRNAFTPSDGIAVVIVTPSQSINNRQKRKDSSQEYDSTMIAAPDKRTQSSPAYRIFRCEWKGCKAELHNLETLRKHVRKLHRVKPDADGIPCLWSNCGKTHRVYDKQTRPKKEMHYPHTFSTAALWDTHMNNKHLESTAWTLGDGPSTHPSDAEASEYLSDSAGRLITPIARTTGPPDPLHLPSEPGPTRAYHNVHGNRTERERAHAVLAACEARVVAVGPGIDRGGCTMVTPEARERLVDDDFAMRVVNSGDDVPDLPGEKPHGKG